MTLKAYFPARRSASVARRVTTLPTVDEMSPSHCVLVLTAIRAPVRAQKPLGDDTRHTALGARVIPRVGLISEPALASPEPFSTAKKKSRRAQDSKLAFQVGTLPPPPGTGLGAAAFRGTCGVARPKYGSVRVLVHHPACLMPVACASSDLQRGVRCSQLLRTC